MSGAEEEEEERRDGGLSSLPHLCPIDGNMIGGVEDEERGEVLSL